MGLQPVDHGFGQLGVCGLFWSLFMTNLRQSFQHSGDGQWDFLDSDHLMLPGSRNQFKRHPRRPPIWAMSIETYDAYFKEGRKIVTVKDWKSRYPCGEHRRRHALWLFHASPNMVCGLHFVFIVSPCKIAVMPSTWDDVLLKNGSHASPAWIYDDVLTSLILLYSI